MSANWHLTDLPILHNHVRLAWQTGDHLNVPSMSADDPSRTSAQRGGRTIGPAASVTNGTFDAEPAGAALNKRTAMLPLVRFNSTAR